jgi:hypothetical protein
MSGVLQTLAGEVSNAVKDVYNESEDVSPQMETLLRVSSKLTLYSENDFEGLWFMEYEERVAAQKRVKELEAKHKEEIAKVVKHKKDLEENLMIAQMVFGAPKASQ